MDASARRERCHRRARAAALDSDHRAEAPMSKILECRSVVPGCDFVFHGDDDEQVMMETVEHMHTVHGVGHVSEQLKARIRAAIREEADIGQG